MIMNPKTDYWADNYTFIMGSNGDYGPYYGLLCLFWNLYNRFFNKDISQNTRGPKLRSAPTRKQDNTGDARNAISALAAVLFPASTIYLSEVVNVSSYNQKAAVLQRPLLPNLHTSNKMVTHHTTCLAQIWPYFEKTPWETRCCVLETSSLGNTTSKFAECFRRSQHLIKSALPFPP